MKVCIVTTGRAGAEPRALKQAAALQCQWPAAEITLVDAGPTREPFPIDVLPPGVTGMRRSFPTRRTAPFKLAADRLSTSAAQTYWKWTDRLTSHALGVRAIGLRKFLEKLPHSIYIVHGIDALLPAVLAARAKGAKVVFDSMEYYADMGDGQGSETASLVASVQRFALPRCSLILAASDEIADLLEVEYSIPRPTPIYNTPSIVEHLPKRDPAMSLYWRNYQVGFGQRGLDDALVALTMLPSDLKLFLQGNPPHDGGEELRHRVDELGLQGRVILLPPFAPGSAITEAAKHTIGLCLERQGPRNHELTVSNKFFDYLMAGLVVVASNMPSLKRVAERSGAALTYQAGSPDSLAAVIRGLVRDPTRLRNLSERGRKFALLEGNSDYDNAKFINAFKQIL